MKSRNQKLISLLMVMVMALTLVPMAFAADFTITVTADPITVPITVGGIGSSTVTVTPSSTDTITATGTVSFNGATENALSAPTTATPNALVFTVTLPSELAATAGTVTADIQITATDSSGGQATGTATITFVVSAAGGGGGGSDVILPPVTTLPAAPPDPTLSDVTVPGGPAVVDEDTSATAIEDALAAGKDNVNIELPSNASSVDVAVDALQDLIDAGASLTVSQSGVSITLPADALALSVPAGAQAVTISIAPISTAVFNAIRDIFNEENRDFRNVVSLADITMKVDGVAVTEFARPLTLSFDVSGVASGTPIAGLRLESDHPSFFGGARQGNTFTFRTDRLSIYGVMSGITLDELRFGVGGSYFTVNATNYTRDSVSEFIPPFIDNGRVLVPLRAIAESLRAQVEWDSTSWSVIMQLDDKTLILPIGTLVPGLDVPARIIDGKTFVPLRYVSEELGANVVWDGEKQAVYIFREVS